MNNINCLICQKPEPIGQVSSDAELLICSRCTQMLTLATPEQIKGLYAQAVKKQLLGLAQFLERSIMEEKSDVPKTRATRSNLVRKRSMRKARSSRHQKWA